MSKVNSFDWQAIRAMYEAGESPAHIEQRPDMPSRQAIHQRAKKEGWQVVGKIDDLNGSMALIEFEGLSQTQCLLIQPVGNGATQKMAASIAGVNESTVSEWKKDDRF